METLRSVQYSMRKFPYLSECVQFHAICLLLKSPRTIVGRIFAKIGSRSFELSVLFGGLYPETIRNLFCCGE